MSKKEDGFWLSVMRFIAGFTLAYLAMTVGWHIHGDLRMAVSWVCGTIWQFGQWHA